MEKNGVETESDGRARKSEKDHSWITRRETKRTFSVSGFIHVGKAKWLFIFFLSPDFQLAIQCKMCVYWSFWPSGLFNKNTVGWKYLNLECGLLWHLNNVNYIDMLAEWSAMSRWQNDVKIDRPTWIFPLWQTNMCTSTRTHTRMQKQCVYSFAKQWSWTQRKLLWFSMRCKNSVDILYVMLLQRKCTHMLFRVRTKQRIQIPCSKEYLCH